MLDLNIPNHTNYIVEGLAHWAKTDRIAMVNRDKQMTFKELGERSDAIAAYLLEKYPNKEPVAIYCDKELDSVCSIYACLKSGHPYTIIASYYPEQRVQSILNVCNPCVVLAAAPAAFPETDFTVLTAEEICGVVEAYCGKAVNYICEDSDIAAIIFTSGSTGVPKGVKISVSNINYWCDSWMKGLFPEDQQGRVIDISNYSFVASFVNILYSLGVKGSKLICVDREMSLDYSNLTNIVIDVNPHILSVTPNFLELLLHDSRFTQEKMNDMTFCCLGGESMTPALAKAYLARFNKPVFWNSYGCTETCAGIIGIEVTNELLEKFDRIPIGQATDFTEAEVVDDDGNVVADGEVGELIVYGAQITQGYYNDPAATDRAFFIHPSGHRAYRTKDLVYIKDGQIFYVGRKDNLAKIGGYRVEMEEVEYHLRQVDILKACAVAPAEKDGRAVMLTAYVVLKDKEMAKLKAISYIRKTISQKLQSYMVPQKIVIMDALPVNTNGKIDRVKLKQMSVIE